MFFELIDTLLVRVESDAEWPGKELVDVFRGMYSGDSIEWHLLKRVIASAAKQSPRTESVVWRLLRRFAPRNDGGFGLNLVPFETAYLIAAYRNNC